MVIRTERPGDEDAVRRVNEAAFETNSEARLVGLLRQQHKLVLSLVAEDGTGIVGHIAFSRVVLEGRGDLRGLGLGPMSVLPRLQDRGIGSTLVRAGLAECERLGVDFLVVLGHPDYYLRFGFVPATRFALRCRWPVPEGVFLAIELRKGSLAGASGLVSYEPDFDAV